MKTPESERIPAHPPVAGGLFSEEPYRALLMTPLMCTLGAMLVFFSVAVVVVVLLPTYTMDPPPSLNWAPYTQEALDGRALYLANGCVYCHSEFSRPQDYFNANYYLYPRVSEPGDYWTGEPSPNVFGTARTGPDLANEAGQHPDDWQTAHYWSPRATTPISIMPRFVFYDDTAINMLIAHNQAQGGKDGLLRVSAQEVGKNLNLIAGGVFQPEDKYPDLVQALKGKGTYVASGSPSDKSPWGLDWNNVWSINGFERSYWLTNVPYPLTDQNIIRAKAVFLERCVGCHGDQGDGFGAAAQFLDPNPYNFSEPANMAGDPGASDGELYYRILTGGKGTAMENFGTRLAVEDVWRLVLFLRTVPNGSLHMQEIVPTMDMYIQWQPSQDLKTYINAHPIGQGPGTIIETKSAPFTAAAHWVAPGLAPGDEVLVGGKMPVTQAVVADLIQQTYFDKLTKAYNETVARGDPLPPKEEVMSIEGLTFHAP